MGRVRVKGAVRRFNQAGVRAVFADQTTEPVTSQDPDIRAYQGRTWHPGPGPARLGSGSQMTAADP
jgi:hypothetical protein